MLDTSFDNLRREIESAEKFRDAHIHGLREVIERYHGPTYRDDRADVRNDEPENFSHEYISLVLPRIIHDTPKFRIRSGNPITEQVVCKRMQIAMNRWSKISGLRRTLERVATDMLFGHGVAMTVSEPRPEARQIDGHDPYLPRIYRISPERFFIDPAATDVEDARYMGHCYIIDKDDLISKAEMDDTWDKELIQEIAVNTDIEEARDESGRNLENRNEIVVYEVWIPETVQFEEEVIDTLKRQNAINGTIFTMVKRSASNGNWSGFVRKPRPYFGPRTGPYTVFGVYTVPDDPYPLSPLVAISSQINDLNAHLTSMRSSAAAYKRLIMVDARNHKLAQDLKDRPHDYIVLSENLDKDRVLNLEVGGITGQQVQYSSLAQDRLDRVSGIHDAMRGNITGSATATEVAVAESSATMRMAHLKRQFQECVDSLGRSVAWYMWHDDRIVLPLGKDAVAQLLDPMPIFVGGVGTSGWEDIEINVDAYSMERVSETMLQKRALELLQITTNVAQASMALPNVKWKDLLSIIGDALNIPNLGDIIEINSPQGQNPMGGMGGMGGSVAPQGMGGGPPMNSMGEPSPIPASSMAGLAAAANRAQ